jgi:hypothetical protein
MNNKLLVGLLSLLLISGLCNNYLSSTVENYGDGNYTVGQVWTSLINYLPEIREASFTVTRATAQSYIDFPIEIVTSFNDPSTAPLWEGMAPGGNIDFTGMKSIKIIKQVGGVWTEIPSQISSTSKCFDNLNNQVDCSEDYYRLSLLRMYFLDNLTSDSQSYNILFPLGFGGSGLCDNCYVFNYNDTSGKYYYTAEYPTRMKYTNSDKKINITEINEIISLTSDFDIESWSAGVSCPTYYNHISHRVTQCTAGSPKLFGLSYSDDIDAPIMIEAGVSNCNLMGLGPNTGYFNYVITPYMTKLNIFSTVSSSSANYMTEFASNYPNLGSGSGGPTIIACAAYTNPSFTFNNFICANSPAESSNATSTTWGLRGGSMSHICGGTGTLYFDIPFGIMLKNTTSSNTAYVGGYTDTYAMSCPDGNKKTTVKYYIDDFISTNNWNIYVAPRTDTSICTISTGYASATPFMDIIDKEPLGGKIQKFISAGSYSTPCTVTTPPQCDKLGDLNDEGLGERLSTSIVCNDDDTAIGFYDNCGNFRTCFPCESGGCFDNGESIACNDYCWGTWTNKTCISGSSWGQNSCLPAMTEIQDCLGAGCTSGQCGDVSKMSTVYFSVYSHSGVHVINNVNVSITGSDNYNNEYTTNCLTSSMTYDACSVMLVAGNYRVTGSKDGYQEGAHMCFGDLPIIYTGNYTEGCIYTVPENLEKYSVFRLLNGTENANLTTLTTSARFKDMVIQGVNISISGIGLDLESISSMSGKVSWEFEANNQTYELCGEKDGWISVCKNITLIVGQENYEILFMDQETDFEVNTGFTGESSRLFASGYISNKLSIPLKFDKPGKLKISRQDIIVRPCKDTACNEYDKVGLNVLYTFGSTPDRPFVYNVDDNTLTEVDLETFKAISRSTCGATNTTDAFEIIDNTGELAYTPAIFVTKTCTYEGKQYKLIFLNSKSADFEQLNELVDSIIEGIKTGSSGLGSVITSFLPSGKRIVNYVRVGLTELMSKYNQDVTTDYVLFNVNQENLLNIMTSNAPAIGVKVQGMELSGLPIEILVNPVYSPLIRTGTDPLVLDSGILNYDVRRTNTAYDYDSSGLPQGGLEGQNWKIDYLEIPVNTNYTFSILYSELTKDVKYDLINGKYSSASLKYFDGKTTLVDKAIDNTKFKVETYLQIAFTPSDGGPTQYEYVKAISFINTNPDQWLFYILIAVAGILILSPVILLLRG